MARQMCLQTIKSGMARPHTQCHVHIHNITRLSRSGMARQIYLQTIRSSMVRPHTQCHVHTQYHKVKSIKHGQTDLPANSQAWPDHIHSAICNEAYTILQARLSRSGMACQAWPDYKQRLVRYGLTDSMHRLVFRNLED
jgi:hypothetical protein